MVSIVILDVDGTLVDTNYLHIEAWARAFAEVGRPVPRAAIHRQIGKGGDQLIPVFVEDEQAARRADDLHSRYYEEMESRGYPLPGAKALLARLAERGHAVWIASSAKPDELERHLDALDARGKVAGVISKGDVEQSKPDADVFETVLERAGCSADEAIVLGDTIWDIEAAKKIGLRTVAVLTGGGYSRAELEAAGAVAVYRDCQEALEQGFPGTISNHP